MLIDLQLNWIDLFVKELLCSQLCCSAGFLQSFSVAVSVMM